MYKLRFILYGVKNMVSEWVHTGMLGKINTTPQKLIFTV